ncbi:CYTH and CHAD domain-containing protein [Cupriavidus oxalaticus]|uniref:CYTH and CHAD domain-containing protein n=1 Tax=Cupriavidus oxalaticus TaxID=96344 RepID=A0A4P7LH32_9BURK|nr:CYTH and CHAD domain-containing protein [Cupriavidus oxalaticus]QBY55524.1 CYTH and CHAD domain-containing protein [Cupriavidus oxalaticus]
MERELKLELLQDDVDRLIGLPLLAACCVEPPHEDLLVSTYFDTPDCSLRHHRASLRVRQAGGHYVLTLKTYGKRSGGLYEREEFEAAIPSPTPDPAALREKVPQDTALAELIRQGDFAERLKPLFVTEIRRKVALLRLPQGDEIELALDRGVIRAGDTTIPVRELEMEIQAGEPAHLAAFALQLLDEVPMRISRASKGDRGYALVAGQSAGVVRAEALRLDDDASAEAVFLCIIQGCLVQVAGNEDGVVNSTNPESVHQMRIGLRRLRSALDIYRSLIACPSGLQDDIKWIAGELGPSRDWEVLIHATLREAFDGAPTDVGADAVLSAASGIATGARQRAAQAVNSERYTRLMLAFSHWLGTAGWRSELDDTQRAALARPAREFALKTLHDRHRRLLKRGRRMAKLDEQQRHRARIAAKKLRYATEFFESLFPAAKLRRFRNHLSELQDDLGWRNDMAVADGLLRSLGAENHDLALGSGYARGYLAGRVDADKQALRRLWKRFKTARLPV